MDTGRPLSGTPLQRAALSLVGNFLIRRVTGLRGVRDATTSFRVIRPEVVRLFKPEHLSTDGYGFFSSFAVLTQANGFTIDEVPITFRPRYSGVSKLTMRQVVESFANLFTLRRQAKQTRQSNLEDQTTWAQTIGPLPTPGLQRPHRVRGDGQSYGRSRAPTRFFDWIVAELKPSLGSDILEVGRGHRHRGAATRRPFRYRHGLGHRTGV